MSFEEKMMFKDNYASIYFIANLRLLCLLSFKYFFVTRVVLKIGEYHSDIPSFYQRDIQSCDALGPITRDGLEEKILMDLTIGRALSQGNLTFSRKHAESTFPPLRT